MRVDMRHIVAVLKLKNWDILKGWLAQVFQFWSLVTTMKITAKVK